MKRLRDKERAFLPRSIFGAVAQPVERDIRIVEVGSSSLPSSTSTFKMDITLLFLYSLGAT